MIKTAKFSKTSTLKPDIRYEYKNPWHTTLGIEHLAILEFVDSQQENSQDVEDTNLDSFKAVATQQQ